MMKWILFLIFTLLLGCSSKQSHFYILNTQSHPQEVAQQVKIGLGPVTVPEYLKRNQIVTRIDANQVEVHDFDRWAERLQKNITRVLAENLSNQLGTAQVLTYPWPRHYNPEYEIAVNILQFDAMLNSDVILKYQLMIKFPNQEHQNIWKVSTIVVPLNSKAMDQVAEKMSEALRKLSEEIALLMH